MDLSSIAGQSVPLLLGAVGGGLVSAVVLWFEKREKNAQELLAQAMEIQSLKEAWILEGKEYHRQRLSDHRELATEDPEDGGLWLRQVEVRTVLDQPRWNAEIGSYYGFISGRRAWIIRDVLEKGLAYPEMQSGKISYHPALISSKGMEELCAWVERVASTKARWISGGLSPTGIATLKVLLLAVAGEDRIKVLGDRLLSTRAQKFLRWYRKKNFGQDHEVKQISV
jgi:hypothetical protein